MVRTMGMRDSSDSHRPTRRWPRKLAASTPVIKITSTVSNAPIPGKLRPNTCRGCHCTGSNDRLRSSVVTMKLSTHNVMPIGIQISRPVMK